MGNSPSSKLLSSLQPPSKPFDKTKSSCLTQNLMLIPAKSDAANTTLQQLILRQDWQRVLIRANLYPSELSKPFIMNLYDIPLQVTPLHLVCALDPPAVVVQLFLRHYVDAAATPLRPVLARNNAAPQRHSRRLRRQQQLRRRRRGAGRYYYPSSSLPHAAGSYSFKQVQMRWQEWRRHRKGAFPVVTSVVGDVEWQSMVDDMSLEQRQFLLPHHAGGVQQERAELSSAQDSSSIYYMPPHEEEKSDAEDDDHDDEEEEDSDNSAASSLSSKYSNLDDSAMAEKDVILQLSPSGGLTPLLIQTSESTDSSSSSTTESNSQQHAGGDDDGIFRMSWDLQPLEREIKQRGTLLPLHVACLYSASVSVLEVLLQAYPLAALADVLGMLPIHWVAGGWTLPPLLRPPSSSLVTMDMIDPKPSGPLLSLKVLRRTVPESLHVRSGNHGMAPEDYVEECMQEGEYKESCMRALANGPVYELDGGSSFENDKTLIFMDSSVSSRTIYSDDDDDDDHDPYGVGAFSPLGDNNNHNSGNRHCLVAGLSGLIVEKSWAQALTLVEDDPSAARKWHYGVDEDPTGTTPPLVWKRLPIHLACTHGGTLLPVGFLEVLLKACPESAATEDPHDGSLPLHIAARARATLPIIKCLLRACPDATMAVNGRGQVPLHVAVLSQAPYTVLECLASSDPEAVTCSDASGKTPIDYAIAVHGADSVTTEFLTMILMFLERKATV